MGSNTNSGQHEARSRNPRYRGITVSEAIPLLLRNRNPRVREALRKMREKASNSDGTDEGRAVKSPV